MSNPANPLETLCGRLLSGDSAALARAISLLSDGAAPGSALHRLTRRHSGRAEVIGITGPPGVGKSTLIDALISALRDEDRSVAVLAVDPSSPITGGAVLGDRTRMGRHTGDADVFIRSVSARGHLGGLSSEIQRIVDVVDAAGWNTIILETVGAGQSETEIAEVADTCVVLNAPGLGDDVQAIKAGILEIADVLVVNKADMPLAERTERQLQAMLKLRREDDRDVPVVRTIASQQTGIDGLLKAIRARGRIANGNERQTRRRERSRRQLAREFAEHLRRQLLTDQHPITMQLVDALADGELDSRQAIARLLEEPHWMRPV